MTVQAIIDEAMINRSTFYDHYEDKYALLNRVEDDILEGFRDIMKQYPTLSPPTEVKEDAFRQYIHNVLEYVDQEREKITLLIKNEEGTTFQSKLEQYVHRLWENYAIAKVLKIPEHYAKRVVASAISSLLVEWLMMDNPESVEDFTTIVYKVATSLIRSLSELPFDGDEG